MNLSGKLRGGRRHARPRQWGILAQDPQQIAGRLVHGQVPRGYSVGSPDGPLLPGTVMVPHVFANRGGVTVAIRRTTNSLGSATDKTGPSNFVPGVLPILRSAVRDYAGRTQLLDAPGVPVVRPVRGGNPRIGR